MTRDEITSLAREADVWVVGQEPYQTQLERFAALVAAAEREMCAEIVERNADACVMNSTAQMVLRSNAAAIRARGQA